MYDAAAIHDCQPQLAPSFHGKADSCTTRDHHRMTGFMINQFSHWPGRSMVTALRPSFVD